MLPPSLQDSLPAGWLAFTGWELNPLDRYERFPNYISFPFPGFILTLDGREHGGPLEWHGARQACQCGPSNDVADAASMCVIVLTLAVGHGGWTDAQGRCEIALGSSLIEAEHSQTSCMAVLASTHCMEQVVMVVLT